MPFTWVFIVSPLCAPFVALVIGSVNSWAMHICSARGRRIEFPQLLRACMTTSHDQGPDLFGTPEGGKSVGAPLAERLRPREFVDFAGQEHITAPDRPLRRAIEADQLSSVIFWGPPGSGKTTLEALIERYTKAHVVSL